ncbi:MAG TPA: hypothetical protein VJ464_20255 [Blastocatellia bacterium]|nr:hypothetical protein [Blastocatellia bacterium]
MATEVRRIKAAPRSEPAKLVRLDRLLGLRGWGLVLYGALPANLALIGAVKVEMKLEASLPLFLFVVPLPVITTYLLIRTRQKEWYLATDRLALRSAITCAMIILLASLITGAARLIQGEYRWDFDFRLAGLFTPAHLKTAGESFLFGIATLVFSSTLFMTILTKGTDLPGLPLTGFVTLLGKVRQGLKRFQGQPIWHASPDSAEAIGELRKLVEEVLTNFRSLMAEPGHWLAKQSLQLVAADVANVLEIIKSIKGSPDLMAARWGIYFEEECKLSPTDQKLRREKERQTLYDSLQRVRQLQLGD